MCTSMSSSLNTSCSQKSPCFFFSAEALYYITSNIPSCCRCPSKKKKERKSGCCLQSGRAMWRRDEGGVCRAKRADYWGWGSGGKAYFRAKMPKNHDNVNIPQPRMTRDAVRPAHPRWCIRRLSWPHFLLQWNRRRVTPGPGSADGGRRGTEPGFSSDPVTQSRLLVTSV